MNKVPCASTIGSLMYAMVYTKLDIANVVEVVSKFMSRKTTLEGSQVDSEISERFIKYMSLLHMCKFETAGLCRS